MTHSPLRRSVLLAALVCAAALPLLATPAHAQQASNFLQMNQTIENQFAVVPNAYKQITVLASLITTMMGINGFYKGMKDPRSAAPLKNAFMVLIGGLLLSISALALIAERSVFGRDSAPPRIQGSRILDSELSAFE